MATKKESKADTADNTTATTTAKFFDSTIIAVVLKDSVIYPKNGVADVTQEQLEQLRAAGSVE